MTRRHNAAVLLSDEPRREKDFNSADRAEMSVNSHFLLHIRTSELEERRKKEPLFWDFVVGGKSS